MQNKFTGNLDGLAGLAGLADYPGLDIRPTLLRVLTDLYVQKPSHSVEEERHYVELALRLIDVVDNGTCAAVAASLAGYRAAPAEVMARLAPISALGYPRAAPAARIAPPSGSKTQDDDSDLFEPEPIAHAISAPEVFEPKPSVAADTQAPLLLAPPVTVEPPSFVELRDIFFAADPETRRLILTNLDVVAARDMPALVSGASIMRYLEQAALAGRRQEFTTLLQQSLGVSRALASRIVSDESGEPVAVAGRALAMPPEVFQRILMFLNPDIGQSVQRVYRLSDLFLDLPQDSALHLLAVWRAADRAEARSSLHRPLHWPDNGRTLRSATEQERKPAAARQLLGNRAPKRA